MILNELLNYMISHSREHEQEEQFQIDIKESQATYSNNHIK